MKIPEEHDGVRLDRFLKRAAPGLPAAALFRLLRKKKIRLNGRPVKDLKAALAAGDELVIEDAAETAPEGLWRGPEITIIFEDEHLLVIDKPRGISVHPGKGESGRTLIDGLRVRARGYEPFLTHRLDKYTSGVLVAAKDRRTAALLGAAFRRESGPETRKIYLTAVFGAAPPRGRIDLPLDRRPALTEYRRLQEIEWSGGGLSLLSAEISTGRTHQIRRHLAAVNLPVAGDDDYGVWELNKRFLAEFRIRHYLLHSRELKLRHPVSGELMTFLAPIPMEFYAIFKVPPGGK